MAFCILFLLPLSSLPGSGSFTSKLIFVSGLAGQLIILYEEELGQLRAKSVLALEVLSGYQVNEDVILAQFVPDNQCWSSHQFLDRQIQLMIHFCIL